MYNKIAPIILNSGKATGLSDVFVAQPDSLKESLAGKIFIIAEIGGKKTEGRKILDFLISSLNETYYNDEKILLRDKIEGLKIENIFEAAISKTNKSLSDFLIEEKIRLNTSATNLTVGVIYENKLYFSSFGKNRALLIYRHGEQYEIINVEANAADAPIEPETNEGDHVVFKPASIFSSVISGEIPIGSYFVFSSEAVPEYISSREMIDIITKLPPIVAAEQLKNMLARINSFIPFLGVIIKNTTGTDNQELRDEVEENLTAHSSISSLNYTEQKTERMLAPAGLISFSKIYKGAQRMIKNLKPAVIPVSKKVYHSDDEKKASNTLIDLSSSKNLSIARPDSFLIKEKIFFKKKPSWILGALKNFVLNIPVIFNPQLWVGLFTGIRNWLKGMNKKNRYLLSALTILIIFFVGSLWFTNWNKKQQAAKNNYNNLVATIEEKENLIDSLSYNQDGARAQLVETRALMGYLPKLSKDQIANYNRLEGKLDSQSDLLQKIVKVGQMEKTNDLSGLQTNNIVFANGKVYAAAGNVIYALTPKSSASNKYEIAGASNLSIAQFDKTNSLYYWDTDKIIKFDLATNQSSLKNVSTAFTADGLAGYKIYGSSLYVLAKNKNQIYRFSADKSGYNVKTDWLKVQTNLSNARDIFVDGSVYVLKADGGVSKYHVNSNPVEFSAANISPAMTNANKIVVGLKNIYIFEASSKRLIVLAAKDDSSKNIKAGTLLNQYQINSLIQPKDFTIDESAKAAYFLDSDMIYRISLNQ